MMLHCKSCWTPVFYQVFQVFNRKTKEQFGNYQVFNVFQGFQGLGGQLELWGAKQTSKILKTLKNQENLIITRFFFSFSIKHLENLVKQWCSTRFAMHNYEKLGKTLVLGCFTPLSLHVLCVTVQLPEPCVRSVANACFQWVWLWLMHIQCRFVLFTCVLRFRLKMIQNIVLGPWGYQYDIVLYSIIPHNIV